MPHPALVIPAIYVAWQLGYFDDWGWSTKPPTPEDLDPETIRDVVAKFGKKRGCSQFNPCPLHQKCVKGNCVPDNTIEPLGMYDGGGMPPKNSMNLRESNIMAKQQLNEWSGLLPYIINTRGWWDFLNTYNQAAEAGLVRPGNPEEMSPDELSREVENSGDRQLMSIWGKIAEIIKRIGQGDGMYENKRFKTNKNMNLTKVKYLIKEQLRILNEQESLTPKPAFYDNMEALYASKGCTGLEKRQKRFEMKKTKVLARTGQGAASWAEMLQMKIDHIDSMLQQLCNPSDINPPTLDTTI